jgi:hypothetical protein
MKSIKTKKVTKINDKTVIATLDIGKNVQYGYFRAPIRHFLNTPVNYIF